MTVRRVRGSPRILLGELSVHAPDPLCACCIDHRPPHPALERALAPEVEAVADRTCERFLHRVRSRLARARDRSSDAQEAAITRAVELFQLAEVRFAHAQQPPIDTKTRSGQIS